MSKIPVILTALFLTLSAHAEQRVFTKTGPTSASVKITPDNPEYVQAAEYVDAAENDAFLQMMLKDKNSPLANIRKQLELENCEKESSDGEWIDGCGQVEFTNYVQTSFGRGGWMSADAAYTFFIGFRHDGTGSYFDASYMVTIIEDVEADKKEDMSYSDTLTKILILKNTTKLPTQDLKVISHKNLF